MEIILASKAGFCFGVKRAIKIASETATTQDGPVTALGPLIHNPQVVGSLQRQGVRVARALEQVTEGTVIIRTHGVKPSVITAAEEKGLSVVDATCPIVQRSQEFARRLHQEGYYVVIIGEPEHPEVIGVLGFADEDGMVLSAEQQEINLPRNRRIGVVAQTTLNVEAFKRMVGRIAEKAKEMKVYNTICSATDQIQKATIELTGAVELMIVVGGHNSANTGRLATLSKELGCPAHQVEVPEELQPEWFNGIRRVGVTAGTSTPDWIIQAVIEKIRTYDTTTTKGERQMNTTTLPRSQVGVRT